VSHIIRDRRAIRRQEIQKNSGNGVKRGKLLIVEVHRIRIRQ
jgi:hypothetical protein